MAGSSSSKPALGESRPSSDSHDLLRAVSGPAGYWVPVPSLAVSLGTRQVPVDPVERSLESLLSLAEKAEKTTMTLQDIPINPTESGRPSTMDSGRMHMYYGD